MKKIILKLSSLFSIIAIAYTSALIGADEMQPNNSSLTFSPAQQRFLNTLFGDTFSPDGTMMYIGGDQNQSVPAAVLLPRFESELLRFPKANQEAKEVG